MTTNIEKRFRDADAQRQDLLDRIREFAAYTIPAVLPQDTTTPNAQLIRSFQNLGADGVGNLVGKLIVALFPPGTPWYGFLPGPKVRFNPSVERELIIKLEQWLYAREMIVQSKLDTTNYRIKHRTVLNHLIVAGNACAKVMDDYRIKTFRFDNWVQKRDSASGLLWLMTQEIVDPLALDDETLAKAQIDRGEACDKTWPDRGLHLYTLVEKQRYTNRWLIRQELNKHQISESDEKVNPYIVSGFEELDGEDYSHSFIELKMGDLRSLNGLSKALLDGLTAAAKLLVGVDETKGVQINDVAKENGAVINARVTAGIMEGVGFLTTQKHQDFGAAIQGMDRFERRLGKSMMLETEMQPKGDRVTATQVMRIARELDGALGGVYAQIAEEIQRPLLDRVMHQMERDKILVPIPANLKDAVETQILTGLEALNRQTDLEKLMAGVQMLGSVPEGLSRINFDIVALRILTHLGVDTTGLLKSPQEILAEQNAAISQQLKLAAGGKAIDTLGNIAENNAKAAATAQTPAA